MRRQHIAFIVVDVDVDVDVDIVVIVVRRRQQQPSSSSSSFSLYRDEYMRKQLHTADAFQFASMYAAVYGSDNVSMHFINFFVFTMSHKQCTHTLGPHGPVRVCCTVGTRKCSHRFADNLSRHHLRCASCVPVCVCVYQCMRYAHTIQTV